MYECGSGQSDRTVFSPPLARFDSVLEGKIKISGVQCLVFQVSMLCGYLYALP